MVISALHDMSHSCFYVNKTKQHVMALAIYGEEDRYPQAKSPVLSDFDNVFEYAVVTDDSRPPPEYLSAEINKHISQGCFFVLKPEYWRYFPSAIGYESRTYTKQPYSNGFIQHSLS
ncbi:hypothetical protein ACGVWS_10410 [Enterobacteriaceae bacterium LUAb1]